MLATDGLLEALNRNDDTENYTNQNEDYDLGEVLRYFGKYKEKHKIRYSDGVERVFSFDE